MKRGDFLNKKQFGITLILVFLMIILVTGENMFTGNIKKVASTMYLLTPINVVVNVEDLKLPEDLQSGEFDFDMKRR